VCIYVTVGPCRDIATLTRPFYLLPLVCVEILTIASFRSLFSHPSPFHKHGPRSVRYCWTLFSSLVGPCSVRYCRTLFSSLLSDPVQFITVGPCSVRYYQTLFSSLLSDPVQFVTVGPCSVCYCQTLFSSLLSDPVQFVTVRPCSVRYSQTLFSLLLLDPVQFVTVGPCSVRYCQTLFSSLPSDPVQFFTVKSHFTFWFMSLPVQSYWRSSQPCVTHMWMCWTIKREINSKVYGRLGDWVIRT